MTVIRIEDGSETGGSAFFLPTERIIEMSIDKMIDSGIATGDDISSSAPSPGWGTFGDSS